jgi:hypothetical protein
MRSKAAPLQAMGNSTSHERVTPFEDVDEDDYDYDSRVVAFS